MSTRYSRNSREDAGFDEIWDDFDRPGAESRSARAHRPEPGRSNDSLSAAEARVVACCDSLRRALGGLEQALERPEPAQARSFRDAPHRGGPAASKRAPGESAREFAGTRAPAGAAPISMRDMSGFLLSKEGDRFLNLLRRMIREEIDACSEDDGEAEEGRSGGFGDDAESLRALVRRRMARRD